MIRQPRRHRGRPRVPTASAILRPQCPNSPAEVVAVHRQEGHRLVDLPILAEAVRPADLPRIASPVRPVVTLHERGVDAVTDRGLGQGRLQATPRAEDPPLIDGDHVAILAMLVHRRVVQSPGQPASRHDPGTPRAAPRRGHDRHAEGGFDRGLVRRILVAGDQLRRPIAEPIADLGGDRLGVLDGPCPRDDRQDQPVLGVDGDVVPVITALRVVGIAGVAVRLLLGDERPLLVELDLAGLGGKRPPARCGWPSRARRPGGRAA